MCSFTQQCKPRLSVSLYPRDRGGEKRICEEVELQHYLPCFVSVTAHTEMERSAIWKGEVSSKTSPLKVLINIPYQGEVLVKVLFFFNIYSIQVF